jgi:hypothetical protein
MESERALLEGLDRAVTAPLGARNRTDPMIQCTYEVRIADVRGPDGDQTPHIEAEVEVVAMPSVNDRVWLKRWLLLSEFADPPDSLGELGIDPAYLNQVVDLS